MFYIMICNSPVMWFHLYRWGENLLLYVDSGFPLDYISYLNGQDLISAKVGSTIILSPKYYQF